MSTAYFQYKGNKKVDEVHQLVNSSDEAKSKIIAELTEKVEALHKDILSRADAAPKVKESDS